MQVGIDMVKVSRIKEAIEKNENFKEKVFTLKEIEYCEKKKNKYESYAARFAAKEALAKALGTGFRNLRFKDIEIENDILGKPKISYKDFNIKVSLSHEREYAIAIAIIEGDD